MGQNRRDRIKKKEAEKANQALNAVFTDWQNTGSYALPEGGLDFSNPATQQLFNYITQNEQNQFARNQADRNYQLQLDKFDFQKELANRPPPPTGYKGVNLYNPVTKQWDTVDISTPDGSKLANEMTGGDWIEIGKIETTQADVEKGTKRAKEEKVEDLLNQGVSLSKSMENFDPNMLTTHGQILTKGAAWAEKVGIPIGENLKKNVRDYTAFQTATYNYVNDLLNALSGAAISEHEYERLKNNLPVIGEDSPSQFISKMNTIMDMTEESIRLNASGLDNAAYQNITFPRLSIGTDGNYNPLDSAKKDFFDIGLNEQAISSESLEGIRSMSAEEINNMSEQQLMTIANDPNLTEQDIETIIDALQQTPYNPNAIIDTESPAFRDFVLEKMETTPDFQNWSDDVIKHEYQIWAKQRMDQNKDVNWYNKLFDWIF